jgi:hypothetical protein
LPVTSGRRSNTLYELRYLVDRLKEVSKLVKLALVVLYKEVIFKDSRCLISLVERKGVFKLNYTLDYKVGTILPNTTVYNES